MGSAAYSDRFLRDILQNTSTIAAVGVSLNTVRPSYYVTRYLHSRGFTILPVNPRYDGEEVFGRPVYPSLDAIPGTEDPVQMVEIFRRSDQAGAVVDEALDTLLDRGLETIWMQIGVIDKAAAKRAEKRGLTVVMDRCPKIEYQRLWGELGWGGFATGIVSSKFLPR